jgi:hypothetical protein
MKRETWLSDVLTSGLMILHLPHNILWGTLNAIQAAGQPAQEATRRVIRMPQDKAVCRNWASGAPWLTS